MDKKQAYEILREIVSVLSSREKSIAPLPEEIQTEKTLQELGIDLIAFSDIIEELRTRFNGKNFLLGTYSVPEEYYYLTLGTFLEAMTAGFRLAVKTPIVVYVDDEEENLFVFSRKYAKRLNLKTFTDPIEALSFIKSNESVSLVITDEVMPKMTGNMLCDEVHKTKPKMKFILITGNPNADEDLMYKALGKNRFYDFINKPVDFEKKGEEYFNLFQGILSFEW
jgi:CheY-like chemotaxis protein